MSENWVQDINDMHRKFGVHDWVSKQLVAGDKEKLQEFLKFDFDVRTIVIDGRILASTKRISAKKDFRSNRHREATTEPYKLSDDEKKVVLDAARSSGAYMVGVDHAIVDGNYYVLECNGSPGIGSNFSL